MAQVTVTISGKVYRMACGDGEEAHLERLAEIFDGRIAELHKAFGEIGDMRLHVMAALTVLDELEETKKRVTNLERETASLRAAVGAGSDRAGRSRRAPRKPSPMRPNASSALAGASARRQREWLAKPRHARTCRVGIHVFNIDSKGADNRDKPGVTRWALVLSWNSAGRHTRFRLRALRGAPGDNIPGALSILKGAVPALVRGLGYTAPTYAVGFPGSILRRPSRLRTRLCA